MHLLAGGVYPHLASTELYNPGGSFHPNDSMVMERYGHTATLLSDGTVLMARGYNQWSAEIYDPATRAWR